MAGNPNNTPLPDDALAELKRLHAAATPGEWRRGGVLYTSRDNACSIVALHNAFSSVIARLEAAEREREELREQLHAAVYIIELEGHGTDEALAAVLDAMEKEGKG